MIRDDYIIRLANNIVQGKYSCKSIKKRLKILEKLFGDFSMPYDISDDSSAEYLNELNEIIHMGIYSEEMILKMAQIAEELYSDKIKKNNMIRMAVPCAVIIICALLILIGRKL